MTVGELFHLSLYHGYAVQIILAEAIFAPYFERRKLFWLRLAAGLAAFAVLSVVLPNLISHFVSGFFSFTIYLLSLGFLLLVFRNKFTEILFFSAAALMTQNIEHQVYSLVYLPFSGNIGLLGQFFLTVLCMAVVYTAAYLIFARRLKNKRDVNINGKFVVALAIAFAVFCYYMQYMLMAYEIDSLWITHPPLLICGIFGLSLQFGLLAYGDEKQENKVLEMMIQSQKKHYEATQESVNMINMKAHDLKNYVIRAKSLLHSDEDGLDEIADAINLYENNAKTGNGILDTVLTEKKYVCELNHIDFTIMADGSALSFMKTGDIISLFANALDNAIEHECLLSDEAKRCIALNVGKKGGMVSVHIENYCENFPSLADGLPQTTKEDKSEHGFGMKSIRYIVNKYRGNLQIGQEGNLFVLNVLFPV